MNLLDLFGNADGLEGILKPEQLQSSRNGALINAGLAMMAASQGGQPGVGRPSLGAGILQGLQAGQQSFQSGIQGQVSNVLTAQKIAELKRAQLMRQGQLQAIENARNADGSIDYRKLADAYLPYSDNPLDTAMKGAELRIKGNEANRLDAAEQGMVSNPFAELSQSGGLHPSVKKLADQYAISFPTLKPDVVDQRYQTLIDMSNKAFDRDQGRQDRLSTAQQAAADRAESLAFRKQLAEQNQTKLKVAPQFAIEGIQSSGTALKKIDSALSRLEDPKQAGGIGLMYKFLPEGIAQKFNPQGTELRADLADLGSQKIKDQSGSTVTISEEPRLLPFIPLPSDDATTAKKKLIRLRQQMVENGQYFDQVYNPNTGFYALPRAQSAPAPQGASSGGFTAKEKK